MADFCMECSEKIFGEDFGDLKGIAKPGQIVAVICEGCGFIYVNFEGKRVPNNNEENK